MVTFLKLFTYIELTYRRKLSGTLTLRKELLIVFTFCCFGILVRAQELSIFESAILPNFSFQYSPNYWSIGEIYSDTLTLSEEIYEINLNYLGSENSLNMRFTLPIETGWDMDGEILIPLENLGFAGKFIRFPRKDNSSFYLPKTFIEGKKDESVPYPMQVPIAIRIEESYLNHMSVKNYWKTEKPAIWLYIDLKTPNPEVIAAADSIVASLQLTLCNDAWVCTDEK